MSGKIRPKHSSLTAQLQYDFIPGPVKIKDGLFMGDELAAKDVEFIITNKVSHIINTVSRRIPNVWQRIGVQYLTLNWSENEQNVFDKKNTTMNMIFGFIEEAMEEGKSCLVHSVNAKSRAFVVVAAYLMKKYSWSLQKTLDYVGSKKDQLEVRETFYEQLKQLETRLSKSSVLSQNWEIVNNQQELVLSNTYKNSKVIAYKDPPPVAKTKKKVAWLDNDTKHVTKYAQDRSLFKEAVPIKPNPAKLKSILKGSSNNNAGNMIKAEQREPEPAVVNSHHHIKHHPGQPQTNNFMYPDDNKAQTTTKKVQNPLLSRPFSSDAKERDKKRQLMRDPKKVTYQPLMTNFKSPYEQKLPGSRQPMGSRVARHTVNGSLKKQQQLYKPATTTYVQRPQSASNTQKRKMRSSYNPYKDEFLVTNSKPLSVKLGGAPMAPMLPTRDPESFTGQFREKWRGF